MRRINTLLIGLALTGSVIGPVSADVTPKPTVVNSAPDSCPSDWPVGMCDRLKRQHALMDEAKERNAKISKEAEERAFTRQKEYSEAQSHTYITTQSKPDSGNIMTGGEA